VHVDIASKLWLYLYDPETTRLLEAVVVGTLASSRIWEKLTLMLKPHIEPLFTPYASGVAPKWSHHENQFVGLISIEQNLTVGGK
jgi:ATP-dependent DNA ligase